MGFSRLSKKGQQHMSGLTKRLEKIERELGDEKIERRRSIVWGGDRVMMTRGYTQKELAALPRLFNGELDGDKIDWFPYVGRGAA